ncbi:rhodanese-related sulfurtransferase [Orbus hercynius]|uniref:Rhodanese-related sulfurtransferase n=1 Tax=Orbus hercynius TaxID=593135 RepID=A0A495RIN6_9GAMM|nr:rhodanese-like domain-containing protein [Orbus hercynius]RKS87402.1 rhodanese-related sulfurtransferase [Orbus hercynius]
MQHNPAFEQLCSTAQKHVKEITIDEVKHLMDSQQLPLFIDVREDNEWLNNHLPYAKHLGRGVIERDIETLVPNKQTTMILYCGGGYRSVLAAESLQKMGYSNVLSMAGGYRGWKEAGYPLVNE